MTSIISSTLFQTVIASVCLIPYTICTLPSLIQAPEDVMMAQGTQALLDCVFSEKPTTFVFWSKETSAFIPDGDNYSYDGNTDAGNFSLTVKNASLANDGYYRCGYTSSPSELGILSDPAKLTILEEPEYPEIENYNNGEEVLLRGHYNEIVCKVRDGNPEASISWVIDSQDLQGNVTITNGSISPLKTTTSQLLLNASLDYDDEKLFCISTHPAYNLTTESTYVTLKIAQAVTNVTASFPGNSQTNVAFPPGTAVTMICSSDGYPEPNYIWLKENSTDVWFPLDMSKNITVTEKGSYACSAKNAENVDHIFSNALHISFSEIPGNITIIQNPQNVTADVGKSIILNCTFSSFVELCLWEKDGNQITNGSNDYLIIGNSNIGDCALEISNIQLEHDGIYICEASGARSDEAIVTVFKAPKEPTIIFMGNEFPDNSHIYLENGIRTISCRAADGNPGATLAWLQNKCFLEGSEESETSTENPKLTTVTSTANVTLDEHLPDVKVSCISRHPAYETPGYKIITIWFHSIGQVKHVTANILNNPKKSAVLSNSHKLELVCVSDVSSMVEYKWEIKDEAENKWKFLKLGDYVQMNAMSATFRCKAKSRFNQKYTVISNEISVHVDSKLP